MKESLLRVALGLALLSAGGASAVQYTWNFGTLETSSSNIASSNNGITVSTDGGKFVFKSTSGDKLLTVTAFETSNDSGTGKLQAAQVTLDKNGGNWGLGVKSTNDSSHPLNVTVDNENRDDVLVFDSGMDNFDWSTLNISYITGTDSSPELTYWAGNAKNNGNGGTDFTKLCLSGSSCSSGTLISASGSGFSSGTTVTASSTTSLTKNNTGRYLVVSGQLPASGGYEKFKISSGGGYGRAPEPESMALIGIGLVAMLGIRRRSAKAKERRTAGFA